jgi:hypothetical protein
LPFDIPPLDLDFSLNSFHLYDTCGPVPLAALSVDNPIPQNFSTHVPVNPSSDVDWSFSQFVSSIPSLQDLLSSEDKPHNLFSIFPSGNSWFDSTIPNPIQPNGEAVDTTVADRAAKEKQLQEMKEAAQKLEEELAAS